VSEIIEDAQQRGTLTCDTTATVETICALTRGLSEQAARLQQQAYDATLDSAKQMIRGTLFARATPPTGE
jgi:hypothetical protein